MKCDIICRRERLEYAVKDLWQVTLARYSAGSVSQAGNSPAKGRLTS